MLERKQHIARLPVVDYPENLTDDSTELAVSIPLFHSVTDTNFADFDVDRFQNIHCKGAIWAALSMLFNTDLGSHGVPVYFHIEDKAWEYAEPMFHHFGVPEKWIRLVNVPEGEPLPYEMNKAHFGKKYIPLLDTGLDPDVLLIFDSDAYILAEDKPLPFYEKLTSPLLKSRPTMTYTHYAELAYEWWVQVLLMATGRPHNTEGKLNELEQGAYKRLGFDRELEKDYGSKDKVWRLWCDNYMVTFPKGHPVRDYTLQNIHTCYCSPYIHSVWSEFHEPFIQLKDILGIPVYNWESDFIKTETYNSMMHCRVDKGKQESRVDEYYDNFWDHLTLNIPRLSTKEGPINRARRGTDDRNLLGGEGKPGRIDGYDVNYKTDEKGDCVRDATYHCVAIPHLPTFKKHSSNKHALNVVDVCRDLTESGQRVIHYGHPDSEVDCAEHVPVQSRELFQVLYGNLGDIESKKYHYKDAVYMEFSIECLKALRTRINAGDFVILFWGVGHHLIQQQLKDLPVHILSPVFEK